MRTLSILLASALVGTGMAMAESFHIAEGSVSYVFPVEQTGEMTFGADQRLTIAGMEFELTDGTSMFVDNETVTDNSVKVVYAGSEATVAIAGNIARYVSATVDGANVTIVQSNDVSAETCGEITYTLSGASASGSFSMEGSFKSTIELNGLDLTNPAGAALDIQNGKRIALKLVEWTENSLSDSRGGDQKGCIVCKGHLELKGKGALTVKGNTSHAIYAKEYIEMKNCKIDVQAAVKDGINCNQYFMMESGTLTISGTGDDGVQVSYKDSADREDEDTGSILIAGGTLNVSVTADAAKGLKCEGDLTVSGGDLTVSVSGHGIWDSAKSKTKASACLASDENMIISGGTLNLTATGGGGKGLNCDGDLTIDNGDITILTSGGVVAYVNGVLSTNYTGNTDRLTSDQKSSPKGIKADGNVTINGGTIVVTTTGNGAEGIESKSVLTINDGAITVNSTDDCINSASHMYIKGGVITVISTGNDGLDSNGNLYIQGGHIMAFGSRSPECGIDANEEEGYTVVFTGGTLLAVGGSNSVPSSSSGSTQPYVSGSGSVTAGMTVTLASGTDTLAQFTVPTNYTSTGSSGGGGWRPGGSQGGSVLVTAPGLASGSSYSLKLGTTTSNVTARLTGSSGPGRP